MFRVIAEGHDLPGVRFGSDGAQLQNAHVAVQVGKDAIDAIRADADLVRSEFDVRPGHGTWHRGSPWPAVHGGRGERFLCLTSGEGGADGSVAMFRWAKLMISDIDPMR